MCQGSGWVRCWPAGPPDLTLEDIGPQTLSDGRKAMLYPVREIVCRCEAGQRRERITPNPHCTDAEWAQARAQRASINACAQALIEAGKGEV